MEVPMDNIKEKLEVIWNRAENLRQLILLCEDGFYQRKEIDFDTVGSVMKCLSVQIEALSNNIYDIVCELEKVEISNQPCEINVHDKNQ